MDERDSEPETVISVLRLPMDSLALAETFRRAPQVYFRFEQVALYDNNNGVPVWVGGHERETIEDALESDSSLDSFTRLYRSGDEWLYELKFGSETLCIQQFVFDHGGSILNAHGNNGTWRVTARFPSREHLSDAYNAMTEFDTNVVLDKIKTNPCASQRPELSDAQYEALKEALDLGYFEIPRDVTLEELAAELNISHQAASERLRRAQKQVFSSILHHQLPGLEEANGLTSESETL